MNVCSRREPRLPRGSVATTWRKASAARATGRGGRSPGADAPCAGQARPPRPSADGRRHARHGSRRRGSSDRPRASAVAPATRTVTSPRNRSPRWTRSRSSASGPRTISSYRFVSSRAIDRLAIPERASAAARNASSRAPPRGRRAPAARAASAAQARRRARPARRQEPLEHEALRGEPGHRDERRHRRRPRDRHDRDPGRERAAHEVIARVGDARRAGVATRARPRAPSREPRDDARAPAAARPRRSSS